VCCAYALRKPPFARLSFIYLVAVES